MSVTDWMASRIVMTIKAPRGTLNLYQLYDPNWYMRGLQTEWQAKAIIAFMEQHSVRS